MPDRNTHADTNHDAIGDLDEDARSAGGCHRDTDGNTDTRAVLAD